MNTQQKYIRRMGICGSTVEGERSKELDKLIRKDFKNDQRVIKILLLGTGESGKSTIVKQMKILHPSPEKEKGFDEKERMEQKQIICNNLLDSIQAILHAVDKFGLSISCTETKSEVESALARMKENEQEGEISPQLGSKIAQLWEDPSIKKTLERRSEYQLLDSAEYFLSSAERISKEDYLPTEVDMLRARSITTGIITVPFKVDKLRFELVDVGGQRSERKKWIHCFDSVTAIMFIIALSEYDQVLYEDETVNRMLESLNLFQQMTNSPFFSNTPFILFLNKEDLFDEKIKFSNITSTFPDYLGAQSAAEAKSFIKKKYMELNQNSKREVFTFFTTATDTTLVSRVLKSVQEIILNRILKEQGLD